MTPEQLKRRLANPGERSKLKDSQLTPELLRQRKLNQRLNAPVVSGSSMTNRDMARDRNAAVETRYGPAIRQNQAQQGRDAGWYDTYLQAMRDASGRQQAQAAQVAQQIQGFGQAGVDAGNAQRDQLLAGLQAQAAPLGAAVDPGVGQVADQASLVRQAMVNSFGANAAANSLAEGGLLRSREAAGGLGKLEHLGDLGKALLALEREKGTFSTDFESDYKDNARKQVLEDQAFGLQSDRFEADQANTLADNTRADAKDAAAAEKDAYQRKHKLGPYKPGGSKSKETKPRTGPGSLSSAEENRAVSTINKVKDMLDHPPLWDRGPGKGKPKKPEEIIRDLRAKNVDPRVIAVAVSLFRNKGKIGPHGVKNAHDLGVHVGGRWGQVK